jgi:hypothetical protein
MAKMLSAVFGAAKIGLNEVYFQKRREVFFIAPL